MDRRTKGAAIGGDPSLEAVGKQHGRDNPGGQEGIEPQRPPVHAPEGLADGLLAEQAG